ncbi:hypothetical protein MTP99_016047 [Tenebrio molitor]|nr:hypothetical protein MTP99_016047 [Tenebrio molitor]
MPHYPIKIAICFRGGYRSGGRGANLLPTPALPLRLHIYPAAFREKKTGQNTTPAESARIGFIANVRPDRAGGRGPRTRGKFFGAGLLNSIFVTP